VSIACPLAVDERLNDRLNVLLAQATYLNLKCKK
jgi:hypothetical protein